MEEDYNALCSRIDLMPGLWPRGPRWPYDDKLAGELAGKIGLPPFMLMGMNSQRFADVVHRHFCHLLEIHDGGGVTRSVKEWVDLACTPAGYDGSGLVGKPPCTSKKFVEKYIGHLMATPRVAGFKPAPPTFPTKCDSCKKVCTSECAICGEIYCSRECMRKSWKDHKRICHTVYENGGNLTALITQMEMRNVLSPAKVSEAFGARPAHDATSSSASHGAPSDGLLVCRAENCEASNPNKRCSACTQVGYCSKKCQKSDWRRHKKECLEMRKQVK